MAIKRFNIKVNGKSYMVDVEEIPITTGEQSPVITQPNQSQGIVKSETIIPQHIEKTQEKTSAPEGKEVITAPLPGKIMALKVELGQTVKAGELICILEAMKMENELYASVNGTIKEILITDGATVAAGEPLVVIN